MLALEYGVADPLIVRDEFWSGQQDFQSYVRYLPLVAVLALVLDACTGVLLVFLFRAAGWQAGRPRPVLNWFDRIPFDALAFCAFWIIAVLINAGDSITYGLNTLELVTELWVGLGFITIGVMGTLLALCLTAAARIRAGTFWHNNVLRMLGSLIGRGLRALARAWPLTGRTVLLFLLYVVCSVFFLSLPFPVWVALQAVALFALCRWTLQWRRVRDGTERILGGEPEFKIDTSHMYYDLAAHAGQLNDLGEAVGTAVDERLRSERFKAELITNVSHDLKTPLTSIINYVDLLRKQGLDSPHAPEYLEVLERKSHRLKKLTEDLVEASKASTGSLPVHLERLGMVQLLQQALGEWEERFVQSGLTAVPTYPAEEAWIMADGRHLWRVIDNLLSNCNKYALEGTRIYIGVTVWEGQVRLSIKNVSRQALNIPAEQLMERFVRGGRIPHHRGLRPGPVYRPQPYGAPGGPVPPGHRRGSVQGGGGLPRGPRPSPNLSPRPTEKPGPGAALRGRVCFEMSGGGVQSYPAKRARIWASSAREAVPVGSSRPPSLPVSRPSPTAQRRASTA